MNIGRQIKKLRIERDMTQEKLAELLNVSVPAISQWECGKTMPDISQIVPLAGLFKVSTDLLFGLDNMGDNEEIDLILKNLHISKNGNEKSKKEIYDELQNALLRYPNNIKLLLLSLNYGMWFADPQSHLYNADMGKTIYFECIRQANLVISYSKDITEILNTHMKIVTLHSANNNIEEAYKHAEKFPWRCDFTEHTALADIACFEKDFKKEAYHCQQDIGHFYDAVLHSFTRLGETYRKMEKYDDALRIFNLVFTLIKVISVDESIMPVLHWTTHGDVHALVAKTYLAMGDNEKAMDWLEKMVDYDTTARTHFKIYTRSKNAYLPDIKYPYYHWLDGDGAFILVKLNLTEFELLKTEKRFKTLLERTNTMLKQ